MKNTAFRFAFSLSKIQKHHVQLFFMTLTVLMLILGAGAPVDGGGISR
jgi:sulfur relay (sulfurtransferase) complex TusBCD TusD component (DsrE family)